MKRVFMITTRWKEVEVVGEQAVTADRCVVFRNKWGNTFGEKGTADLSSFVVQIELIVDPPSSFLR